MWPYVKPYLFRGVLGIIIAIPVGLLDGVTALAVKPYLDVVVYGKNPALASLIVTWIPFIIIGFALLQGVLKYLNNYLNDWTGQKITIGLKKDLFNKLLTFETAFYDKNSSGIVMTRFVSDADGACGGIITNLKTLITTICSSLSLVGVLVYASWKLSIIAVIIFATSMLPMKLIRNLIKHASFEGMKIGSRVTTFLFETIHGNRIVTSFNLQNYQFEKLMEQITQSFNLGMKVTKRVGWLSPMMYLISSVGIALAMWYGNHLIINKELSGGSFASFILALIMLYRPVKSLGETLAGMQGSFITMNRVVDLFDLQPSIKNIENPVKINTIKDYINLENVWFEYEEDRPVLKGINLNIKIGTSLALVGNSGGGKTTVANLIPRFYEIKEGTIKIDGINLKDIELESLRQNIAVVFQDNFLFTGSIKDNILMGNFKATDEEILKAVKDAYLDEFIASLPEGIETEIGERGVRLSGGQKQRLAIARAMIKNAPVVILDEATSALDNKSEAIVQKALDKLMENRTVIVIAHRLSTIKNADKIAVINEGQIVELGTHEDLINIPNGNYKMLYEMQFKQKENVEDFTEAAV
jgi:subfamily B ATP-binding cassette protein MsbA